MKKYDLIVAGGGMSGVSAAVTGAKKGLNVLLIEQNAILGGMGTAGLITMVMSSRKYFYGLGRTIIDSMISEGSARFIENPAVKGYNYYPFDAEAMKLKLDSLLLDSGVEVLFYTKIIGVKKAGRKITEMIISKVEGISSVSAEVFVDATGGAIVCSMAGEQVAVGDENGNTQAPTMMAYYSGIDFNRYEEFLKQYEGGEKAAKIEMIHSLIPIALKDGILDEADLHHPGIFRIDNNNNVGVMNAGHIYSADCTTSAGLTNAVIRGRQLANKYLNFYKKYVAGFENAYLTNTGSVLGLRETGRLIGKYITTFEDKSTYRKFDDAIMRFDGGAVSDLHASSAKISAYKEYLNLFSQREKIRENDFATLPFRSLLPINTDNLIAAGRCISADRKVLGQIRIMGYCYMMGEAAGLASFLAIKHNIKFENININELQKELLNNGIETI